MKPLNTKERRLAFLKFFLLFLACVALIMVSVFWTYQVPVKENKLYRENSKLIYQIDEEQRTFAQEMEEIKSMLDSVNLPEVNAYYTDQLINSRLAELRQSVEADTSYRYMMYTNVVKTYLDLQEAKKQLRDLSEAEIQLEECKQEVINQKSELDRLERDLAITRQTNRR